MRVIDGDTIVLDLDLGFRTWLVGQSFRLAGCNAIEREAPGGPEAAAHLAELLPAGTLVTVTSVKNDKFGGRYDALVELADGTDLVQLLIRDGWAASWDGHGTKPSPPWPRVAGS